MSIPNLLGCVSMMVAGPFCRASAGSRFGLSFRPLSFFCSYYQWFTRLRLLLIRKFDFAALVSSDSRGRPSTDISSAATLSAIRPPFRGVPSAAVTGSSGYVCRRCGTRLCRWPSSDKLVAFVTGCREYFVTVVTSGKVAAHLGDGAVLAYLHDASSSLVSASRISRCMLAS